MSEARRSTDAAEREIVTVRVIRAPRELVFEAFSDPEHLSNWWGPRGFTTTTHEMDFKVGGVWRHTMHGPDGTDYPNYTVYTEISEPSLIKYDHSSGEEDDEHAFEATIELEEQGEDTKLTLRLLFKTVDECVKSRKFGAVEGGVQTLQRLEEELLSRDAFVIERTFDAPRELVFDVWTQPEHLMKWYSPKGFKSKFKALDIRPGGITHYCMTSPDGLEVWGKVEYLEIERPDRLMYMQWFSDADGGIGRHPLSPTWPVKMLTTITFAAEGDKTRITLLWNPVDVTAEERETFEQGRDSMKQGWGGTFELLDNYLAREK